MAKSEKRRAEIGGVPSFLARAKLRQKVGDRLIYRFGFADFRAEAV